MSDKTFLLELREQAQQEPDAFLRSLLREQADDIESAITVFQKSLTSETLARLNGEWARGWRYLTKSQERPEPEPPLAGSPEVFAEDVEEAA